MTKTPIRLQDLRRRLYVKAKAEPTWRFWGLYVHVCKRETLWEAYQLAKENDGAPGIDGVTFQAIEAGGLERFLEQLREELVQGSYRPRRLRKVKIPKEGGKTRQLSIPCIRDRVVQGALKLILEPIFEADFQPGSFGYRPKKSAHAAALVLVDHQVGLMTGVRDIPTGELKHNVVALAKAAKALKLPIVVTTTARDSMWGPTFPELVEALPGIEIIDRSSVNAFDDVRVAHAIEATNRKKLIFAGISLEVCAAFPAITAVGKGLNAYVAVDASATFSETKRQAGLLRMLQAGVIVSDYTTLMVEILKDNARPEAGEVYGAMDMGWAKLVGQIADAYRR